MPEKDNYPDESKMNRSAKLQPRKGPEWIEVPVFIHGISPDKFPATSRGEYKQLLATVRRVKEYWIELNLLPGDAA